MMGQQKKNISAYIIHKSWVVCKWASEEKDEGDWVIGGCTKLVFEQVFTQHFLKGEEGRWC